jgi:hypothetical protein
MSDTVSIDSIVGALYASISGPAGEARDWRRFRSLFLPGARLVRTVIDAGGPRAHAMDVAAYERDTSEFFGREPFYEVEVSRKVERFGCIAHALSAYEARRDPRDAAPWKRGVNSIQLFHDGRRFWIVSVLWDDERP